MNVHQISAEHLTIERIGEIINNGYKIELSDDARNRIVRCREYLDKKISETEAPIYGVTTGFGSLCNVSIGKDHLAQLQINLMMLQARYCRASCGFLQQRCLPDCLHAGFSWRVW